MTMMNEQCVRCPTADETVEDGLCANCFTALPVGEWSDGVTMSIECALGEDCNCAPYDDDDDDVDCDDCPHCEHVLRHADTGLTMRYRIDGRLGDICAPDGEAIDCVQIADYDWTAGRVIDGSQRPEESFLEWIKEAFQF